MAVDKAKLRKTIMAILEDADLDTVSAKKVRQQVEAKLKVDLTDRKKEVDDLVMEIVEEKQDANKSEEADDSEEDEKPAKGKRRAAAKKDDSEDGSGDEYEPEGKKSKGKKKGSDSDDDLPKKKKPAAKGKAAAPKKAGGTGYTKTCKLSPELSLVMGEEAMARHEVVKKMLAIIKEKNLYDPKNKQFAICDDKLLPVFGVKRFRTFGMMKYLKNHFVD